MSPKPTYLSTHQALVPSLPRDFEPDADLGKPTWQGVPELTLQHYRQPGRTIPGVNTGVAVAYTPSRLYLGYRCQYFEMHCYQGEDPGPERWLLWDRDVVEVFVNPFPERMNTYWEFEVAPNNQWIDLAIDLDRDPVLDAGWDSGFAHATRVDEDKREWTCEMSIPAGAMGVASIRPGMEWRINFFRCDGVGEIRQRRLLAWSPPLEDSFHVPSRFGTILFQP